MDFTPPTPTPPPPTKKEVETGLWCSCVVVHEILKSENSQDYAQKPQRVRSLIRLQDKNVETERGGVPFDKTPEVAGINVLHLWYIEVAACSLEKTIMHCPFSWK